MTHTYQNFVIAATDAFGAYARTLSELTADEDRFSTLDQELARETPGQIMIASAPDLRLQVESNSIIGTPDYSGVCEGAAKVFSAVRNHYEDILLRNGAVDRVVRYLGDRLFSKKAVIGCWEPNVASSPCLMYVWFRPEPDHRERRLACHAHFRGNDVYRKLLMNLEILGAVHAHVANLLGLSVGKYTHYSDSLHIYKRDWVHATAAVVRLARCERMADQVNLPRQ